MSELDALIRQELEELAPEPSRKPDWDAVRRTARPPLHRRRRLVLAVAAVVAVIACATALAAGLGGFDDWLRGQPGKPAPESEQRGFRSANGRSWAAFPASTELRELIRTQVDGRRYVLNGFRSGSSVCLRLQAISLNRAAQACAPVSTVARITAPILVVNGDHTFYDHRNRPSAEVSFGLVADGVSSVEVHAVDGTHRAHVGGNAYLFVENEPNTANRVLRVTAVGPAGRRTTVEHSAIDPLQTQLAPRRPTGPTKVDAPIDDPQVGWYLRGEKRGVSPAQVKLTPRQREALGGARIVKPDPLSDVVVGLEGMFCQISLHGFTGFVARGCGRELFPRGPLNVMMSGHGGEFMVVQGIAADGVTRLTIFLADGQRQAVPLRHNVFAALVAWSQFPIRIVGYDARGRVAAIETPPSLRRAVPAKARRLEPVLRLHGPNDTAGVLQVSRRVQGYHCWRVDFSTGQSPGRCVPPTGGGPKIQVDVVQPAGRDVFIIGAVHQVVSRVQLRFEDGSMRWTRPVRGHFMFAVPREHLRLTRQFAIVRGFDRQNHRVQRQGLVFRAG